MLMCCKLPVFLIRVAKCLAAIELSLNNNRLYANLHFVRAFIQTFAQFFLRNLQSEYLVITEGHILKL